MITGCSDEEAYLIACAIGNTINSVVEISEVATRDIADTFFKSEVPEIIQVGEFESENLNYRNEVRNFLKGKRKY